MPLNICSANFTRKSLSKDEQSAMLIDIKVSHCVPHNGLISVSTVFSHRRLCTLQLIVWEEPFNSSQDKHCRVSLSILTHSCLFSHHSHHCINLPSLLFFFHVSLFPSIFGKTRLYFSLKVSFCSSRCPSIHESAYPPSALIYKINT